MIFGKHVNKYYLKYSYAILLGILALLLVDFFQLKIPELYRMIINGIENGAVELDGQTVPFNMSFVLEKVCMPMLLIVIAMVVGRFLWRICLFGTSTAVETDIRHEMFNHTKELSQEFYQKNKVGSLMSLFINDLETINECFGDGILMFFDALLLGTLAVIKMARMSIPLTLLSLLPMTLLFIISTVLGKSLMNKWEKRQAAFSDLSDFSQESFSGIAVVKAFVRELHELMSFKKLNKNNEETNVDFTKTSTLLHICVTLFVESVICIIIGYGGYLVYVDKFDVGQLVEFISYFTSIVWPIMAVSQLIEMSSRGKASLKRIGELLDTEPTLKDRDGVTDIKDVRGDVEFRSLSFRYPDADIDSLKNVSFKINAGESVGIIGKTGSGKTTIVDLILRTYAVGDGMLFVDGRDVNDVSISSVRAACAYVPQDNFLFSDTIEANIAFSDAKAPHSDVERSAVLADVHENIVDFKDGYGTLLGERGVTVSGGQKQRISIARALMKDAPILILDDSVSAVDTKTERVIIDNLKANRRGRTTMLIAHRISTVEQMDKIIFVDDGEVIAVGSHNELLETCSEYKKMVELQKLDEEKEVKKNV